MLTGIGSLPRFLHGGYFGARGIKTSRGRASAVSSAGNSSFPNSPPRLMLNQTLRREGWRVPSRSVQSGRARGCPRPIRSSQMPPAPRQTRDARAGAAGYGPPAGTHAAAPLCYASAARPVLFQASLEPSWRTGWEAELPARRDSRLWERGARGGALGTLGIPGRAGARPPPAVLAAAAPPPHPAAPETRRNSPAFPIISRHGGENRKREPGPWPAGRALRGPARIRLKLPVREAPPHTPGRPGQRDPRRAVPRPRSRPLCLGDEHGRPGRPPAPTLTH